MILSMMDDVLGTFQMYAALDDKTDISVLEIIQNIYEETNSEKEQSNNKISEVCLNLYCHS